MKKKVIKNKLPKYEFGTYVQNPGVDLQEAEMALVKAKAKASANPWVIGTKMFGNIAGQIGSNMMSKGMSEGQGTSQSGFNWGNLLQQGLGGLNAFAGQNQFAFGGKTGMAPIEVEGEEVIETPNGSVNKIKGPSHSEGGVDLVVPTGSEIFSKRVKGADGKTMAERKLAREKMLSKLEKDLKKNPGNTILKNTYKRTKDNTDKEDQQDMMQMQMAKMLSDITSDDKFAWGGLVNPWEEDEYGDLINKYPKANITNSLLNTNTNIDTTTPQNTLSPTGEVLNKIPNIFGNLTAGDMTGLFGNLISTFGPMKNTQANRAGDTPNINAFKNYGQEGLTKLDESKQFAAGVRDNTLSDLELSRNTSVTRNRNSARGINTLRALDLASDMGVNNTKAGVYNNYAQQLQGIYAQQAQMENQQDQVVMGGEQARDLADRQDRDNYFSQMAQDIATKGTGLQQLGKNFNQIKSRNITGKVLNSMFNDFEINSMTGEMKKKVTSTISANSEFLQSIPDKEVAKTVINKIANKEWYIKNNTVYDSSTNKEVNINK